MTSPYDLNYVDLVEKHIITKLLEILFTRNFDKIKKIELFLYWCFRNERSRRHLKYYQKKKIVLMQCNTNYTSDDKENLKNPI